MLHISSRHPVQWLGPLALLCIIICLVIIITDGSLSTFIFNTPIDPLYPNMPLMNTGGRVSGARSPTSFIARHADGAQALVSSALTLAINSVTPLHTFLLHQQPHADLAIITQGIVDTHRPARCCYAFPLASAVRNDPSDFSAASTNIINTLQTHTHHYITTNVDEPETNPGNRALDGHTGHQFFQWITSVHAAMIFNYSIIVGPIWPGRPEWDAMTGLQEGEKTLEELLNEYNNQLETKGWQQLTLTQVHKKLTEDVQFFPESAGIIYLKEFQIKADDESVPFFVYQPLILYAQIKYCAARVYRPCIVDLFAEERFHSTSSASLPTVVTPSVPMLVIAPSTTTDPTSAITAASDSSTTTTTTGTDNVQHEERSQRSPQQQHHRKVWIIAIHMDEPHTLETLATLVTQLYQLYQQLTTAVREQERMSKNVSPLAAIAQHQAPSFPPPISASTATAAVVPAILSFHFFAPNTSTALQMMTIYYNLLVHSAITPLITSAAIVLHSHAHPTITPSIALHHYIIADWFVGDLSGLPLFATLVRFPSLTFLPVTYRAPYIVRYDPNTGMLTQTQTQAQQQEQTSDTGGAVNDTVLATAAPTASVISLSFPVSSSVVKFALQPRKMRYRWIQECRVIEAQHLDYHGIL